MLEKREKVFLLSDSDSAECFTHDEGQHSLLDRLFKVTILFVCLCACWLVITFPER